MDFYVAQLIWRTSNQNHRKILLGISICGNLGLLGFFKYTDFAITQFNIFGNLIDLKQEIPLMHIFLPVGISFYTFQTIAYTIDVYRKSIEPRKSFLEFSLFVSFFPQLVAGPIIRAKTFFPQITRRFNKSAKEELKLIIFENSNLKLGASLMALGLFKKMVFADNIAPLVNQIFHSPIGSESFTIILGAIGFGIQVYCDFSGYSDIAIGAALILGIKIPKNFNKPFFAKSPSDYWWRWHISLTTWVRDYLYYPLIWKKKKSTLHILLGLFLSMLILGIWHGAGWNWVIFGVIWGIILVIQRYFSIKFPTKNIKFFKTKVWTIIATVLTQYFVFSTFLAFRITDPEDYFYSIQKYVILDFNFTQSLELIKSNEIAVGLIIIFFILHTISFKINNLPEKISNLKNVYFFGFIISITVLILLTYDGTAEQFVYFQF